MTETDIVARLRAKLGGVQIDAMQGDNLAITLCTAFDDPDEEVEDETYWGVSAIIGCTATLDAIHAHYAAHIARLEERCAALTGQVEAGAAEIERLTKERDTAFRLTGCECQADECCRHLTEAHARAEAAERDRDRLREALENISAQETRYGNATVSRMTNIARAALQPQEPKP